MVVKRKVSKERRLNDIYETAKASIGLHLPLEASAIRIFRMVVAEARSLIKQRGEIELMADKLLGDRADSRLLRRVPGVEPINAPTIIPEAGDPLTI